jgi:DNA-binding NarL/FixJ family response regulator
MSQAESGRAKRIGVLVVDDHALLREGLLAILREHEQISAVEEAASYEEAVEKVQRFRPDVVLVDAWLDDSIGIELLTLLRTAVDEPKLVVLSVDASEQALVGALQAGVRGLLDRTADGAQLVDSVLEVARNETFISRRLIRRLISTLSPAPDNDSCSAAALASLTEREREILEHVALGETNRAIASALYLSQGTIRAHLRSIMRKLNIVNRVQAATIAYRLGVVPLSTR